MYDGAGTGRRVEPGDGLVGIHLAWILKCAGRADEPAFGHGEGDVVRAVVHVKFAAAHVRVGGPSVDVVIDGDLGIPVTEEEHLAVLSHARGAGLGYFEVPRKGQRYIAAGQERGGEWKVQTRPIEAVARFIARGSFGDGRIVEPHVGEHHATGEFLRPVSDDAGLVEILPQMDDDLPQGIGRVVVIPDGLVAAKLLCLGGECGADRVFGRVRPVIRPRRAGRRACTVCDGFFERWRRNDGIGAGPVRLGLRRCGETKRHQSGEKPESERSDAKTEHGLVGNGEGDAGVPKYNHTRADHKARKLFRSGHEKPPARRVRLRDGG